MPKHKTRGNGQGTAYKRGNTWTAQVVIGWNGNVPIKRTKGGFKSKKDAINYCPTLKEQLNPKKKALPLIDYWEQYKKNDYLLLSDSKQCSYRCAWKKLKKLYYRTIDQITVQELRDTVSDTCKTHYTAKDCRDLLTNIYRVAAADGVADRELPSYIILPQIDESEREAFSPDEQKALWKLYESGDMDAAIPLLMIYTGAMPGEVRNTKVENIDMEHHVIRDVGLKTQTRKSSPIILSDTIMPVVESLIEHAQKSGYLWKRNKADWYEMYYNALKKAGCRELTPYSCRHTTATALAINEDIAPATIQKVMRWSSTAMLQRYTHPDINYLVEAVNKI